VKSIADSLQIDRATLDTLRSRISRKFPEWAFRMTLFGSRTRGDAEPDSDMDVLVEIDTETVSFPEKQRLRRIAGEVSMDTSIILSFLTVDRTLKGERGDFSIFQNIRDEGIPI
jgi:predicted nucleotidyltransferase